MFKNYFESSENIRGRQVSTKDAAKATLANP
jgi:hypothetical protein